MELVLVRHAIAGERDPERWPDDCLRPLTKRGRRRFEAAARGLATLIPAVDVHLASPCRRAWDTAAILTDEAGWRDAEQCPPLAPGEATAGMLPVLKDCAGAGRVALVGHEPRLSELVSLLVTGESWRLRLDLKKGGAVVLRMAEAVEAGSATVVALLPPRVLRSLR